MVKNKRMSRSTILVVALSLLLVLSLALGLTGAWFTSQATSGAVTPVTLKFGTVEITTAANYTNVHNKVWDSSTSAWAYPAVTDPSNVNRELVSDGTHNPGETGYQTTYGAYYVEPGTRIASGISFTNSSNVGIYYLIKMNGSYYVFKLNHSSDPLYSSNPAYDYYSLQKVVSSSPSSADEVAFADVLSDSYMAAAGTKSIAYTITMNTSAYYNDYSLGYDSEVWTVQMGATSVDLSSSQTMTRTVARNSNTGINLGNYIFNTAFEVRAIQADNIGSTTQNVASDVWSMLTNDSATWNTNGYSWNA